MNSSTTGDSVTYPVSMTMDQWSYIDGCMDNDASVETVGGDRQRADLARSIRRAGWEQIAHWTPGVPGSGSWPPMEATVTPRLTAEQWRLVPSVLDRWLVPDEEDEELDAEELAETTAPEAAAELRALISAQLTEQGVPDWSTKGT
ncbi:hypothetical protein GCM10020220_065210 [Nonomuraea rubra]